MSYHLPCDVAIEIRDDHETGLFTTRELAERHHVSQTAIQHILTGKSHQDCADHTEPGVPKTLGAFLAGE